MSSLQVMNTGKTMDSREIAELTGKEHKHVLRDIRNIIIQLEVSPNLDSHATQGITTELNDSNQVKCYKLPYRETMILVSGYSVELRAKVVDRWIELEQEKAQGGFFIPKTYAQALQLATDQAIQLEQQQLKLEQSSSIIKELQPKAEFFDDVMGSNDLIDMADVAKIINKGYGRNELFKLLRNKKVLQASNKPYQRYVDNGLFKIIEERFIKSNGDIGINLKTLVTQKGLNAINKLLTSLSKV